MLWERIHPPRQEAIESYRAGIYTLDLTIGNSAAPYVFGKVWRNGDPKAIGSFACSREGTARGQWPLRQILFDQAEWIIQKVRQ